MISFNLTNSSVEDVEIGGLAFFLVYISECLPYVVLIALGEIVGVIGDQKRFIIIFLIFISTFHYLILYF